MIKNLLTWLTRLTASLFTPKGFGAEKFTVLYKCVNKPVILSVMLNKLIAIVYKTHVSHDSLYQFRV